MTRLTRQPGWDRRALAVLNEELARPFEYGVSDCSTMAARIVEAVTGHDPLSQIDWHDEDGAHAAIRARGGLDGAVSAILPPVNVMSAQRFDIGLWQQGLVTALVVCDGRGFAGKTIRGALRVPREQVVKAWATGR